MQKQKKSRRQCDRLRDALYILFNKRLVSVTDSKAITAFITDRICYQKQCDKIMPRSRVKQNPLLTVDNKLLLQKHTQKYKIIGHTVDLFVINTAVTGKNSTFKNIVSRSFIQPYQSIKSDRRSGYSYRLHSRN